MTGASFPDLRLHAGSRFVAELGLEFDVVRGDLVTGRIPLGPQHHDVWGAVHRGVFSTVVERAASVGASAAVDGSGRFAVGVHNATDVFTVVTRGAGDVRATPAFQDDVHQVWSVEITVDGVLVAQGRLRLQNVPRDRPT